MRLSDWDEKKTEEYRKRWRMACLAATEDGRKQLQARRRANNPFGSRLLLSQKQKPAKESSAAQGDTEGKKGSTPSTGDGKATEFALLLPYLARLLSTQSGNPVTPALLHHLEGSDNRDRLYHEAEIPKKRGGARTIAMPQEPLRWVQRSLLQVLTHLFPRHRCAHGFERGRSIITHARPHVGRRWVYAVDIKGFFPSITWGRLYGMFQAYPFEAPPALARRLANLTTYRGHLPQGAPTSPILANLLCRRLDSRLFKWAREHGYLYTRYADDLAFSTNRSDFPENDRAFIEKIIESEGFTVHPEKRRLMPTWGRQVVTGLIVNEKLNVPKERVRSLRALLHNVEEHGWESQVGRQPYFEEAEAYAAYCAGELDAEEVREAQKKQDKEHLLLNPAAELPKATDAHSLQRIVRGQIEFIGQVKGQEDRTYRRLKEKYETLIGYEQDVEQGRREAQLEPAPDLPKAEGGKYKKYKALENQLEEGSLTEPEYRDRLREWSEDVLEFGWKLDEHPTSDALDQLKKDAREIAFSLDTSPSITARFFRAFNSYRSFRGLLHDPQRVEEDGTISFPDGTETRPGNIIGACRKVFEELKKRLPNGLREETKTLLEECDEWLRKNPGKHPWRNKKFREEHLKPYKRATAFGEKHDLPERLQEKAEELEKEENVQVHLPEFGVDLYTFTPDILDAINILLTSMAQHAQTGEIQMDMEHHEPKPSIPEVIIRITEDGSQVRGKLPKLRNLLSGESQGALYRLRGYARWTITAPFACDDTSYRFDVMRNRREQLEKDAPGFCHELTFYQ